MLILVFQCIYFDLYLRASALKKIPGWDHQSFGFFPLCVLGIDGCSWQPKFQSQIFYGYQNKAIGKTDKTQPQILQTIILNGYNFIG